MNALKAVWYYMGTIWWQFDFGSIFPFVPETMTPNGKNRNLPTEFARQLSIEWFF